MEIDKLKIDDDLIDFVSTKSNVTTFINDCIRERKKKETPLKKETVPNQTKTTSGTKTVIFCLVFAVFVTIILAIVSTCNSNSPTTSYPTDSLAGDSTEYSNPIAPEKGQQEDSNSSWDFQIEKDPMTSSNNIWATITSTNSVNQDEPYGITDCNITIRYTKKWGYDAIIGISDGQIFGNEFENENYVMVRFDEGAPIKYWFNSAADGSSEDVFIRRKSDFIARCKKAKSIKVELPLYQGGRPVFDFSVDKPLKWRSK